VRCTNAWVSVHIRRMMFCTVIPHNGFSCIFHLFAHVRIVTRKSSRSLSLVNADNSNVTVPKSVAAEGDFSISTEQHANGCIWLARYNFVLVLYGDLRSWSNHCWVIRFWSQPNRNSQQQHQEERYWHLQRWFCCVTWLKRCRISRNSVPAQNGPHSIKSRRALMHGKI